MSTLNASPPSGASPRTTSSMASTAPGLQRFVFALFFVFGGITSLNDVLIPKLKGLFVLSYAQVMLVQSAFFLAYLIFSLPAAQLVKRLGYMRSAVAGLLTMTAGCLLFIPAAAASEFAMFLAALFVLASGITIVQVVANPLISLLGPAETAHSRLTFAQAFNSLGTTVFPYFGSIIILGSIASIDTSALSAAARSAYRRDESHVIVVAYFVIAIALVVVAAAVWRNRKRLTESQGESVSFRRSFELFRRRRFAFGVACIFLYVGAEVAIGSVIVSYLMSSKVLGISAEAAGKHVPLYWGGAMVGRFIGASLLRVFPPGLVLAAAATGVLVLLAISANSAGALAAYTLLAVGLFNSIMFPTVFSLACEGLGERAADGSGIICMAIVGGAVIPLLTGHIADRATLQVALLSPALCYLGIAGYGIYARKRAGPACA